MYRSDSRRSRFSPLDAATHLGFLDDALDQHDADIGVLRADIKAGFKELELKLEERDVKQNERMTRVLWALVSAAITFSTGTLIGIAALLTR